ncbi:hypothetical protein [Pedobacter rhizosphaerae]|uniref:Uncharacterized protein n=1 Tax=Pedobacter rhizosphaerae TaxID=390241 RepID=A0A1H9VP60_9SPHI|nr:hypothetical protein [Pedobacter rhizosphaerae]SES23516.1 hypothetical protein SAMN04488023_14623 [Pedobacter rhizosphaerae]
MGITSIKFTIKHPPGIAVIRMRINYVELGKAELDAFKTAVSPGVVIEGTMSVNVVSKLAVFELEAVGTAHLAGSLQVNYKGKDLLVGDKGAFVVEDSGRVVLLLKDISLI